MKYSLPCLLSAAIILAGCTQIRRQIPSGPNVLTGRATLTEGDATRSCEDVTLVRPTNSVEIKRLAAGKPSGVAAAQQNGQTFIFVGAALAITALGLIASSHAYLTPPASPSSTQ